MIQTIIMRCRHCGNKTQLENCGEYSEKFFFPFKEPDEQYRYWVVFTYRLYKCHTCLNPTLERTCSSSSEDIAYDNPDDFYPLVPDEVLYPIESKVLNDIPLNIRKNYEEALKVRIISPRSCAVFIGTTLEAICDYEKAQGKTLSDRINSLANSKNLPPQVTDIIHKLRNFRNFGAHDDKYKIQEQDIPLILSLTETLLEYLYVAPTKLKKLQEKLQGTPLK